ncbi:hypothetical protein [[Limnothrix rosea] IAM M-220]|uniref:hypothetical protein n=1 Tax=[Limnothrix rosea] IAM M-220 TaxID=454133 RepID=UPI001C0E49A1|nr:hypothetical protein [[Limnothrix rosea] IAM M-220]
MAIAIGIFSIITVKIRGFDRCDFLKKERIVLKWQIKSFLLELNDSVLKYRKFHE